MDKLANGGPRPEPAASGEYAVGRFTLQPFRQLLDCGRHIRIQPKALAILSVLAEADGQLVTKDDLMAAVWPNITVEDNAIHAHVASLRKILGRDAELLSTVHGLGYRLASTPAPACLEPSVAPPIFIPHVRPVPRALAAALLAIIVVAGVFLYRNAEPATPEKKAAQIAILPFDLSSSAPEMNGLANDLRDQLAADLSLVHVVMASGQPGKTHSFLGFSHGPASAEFLLGGRIKSDGKTFDVHMQISDADEGVAVWSGTFQGPMGAQAALLTKAANAAANAAQWAIIGRAGKVRLNAAGVAALIEALGGNPPQSGQAPEIGGPTSVGLEMAAYRKIIALAPQFSWGHSGLAVAQSFQFRVDPANEALRKEAQQEAHLALKLEPHNGEAYVALELAAPRFNWSQREALLLKGAAAEPGFEPAAMMEARLLWGVGRSHDALIWFARAYDLDPLHNDNNFTYAASLASEGLLPESQKVIEQMDARWPGNVKTRDAHFWASVLSGKTSEALAIVSDTTRWPLGMNRESAGVWRAALTAQVSNDKVARARAIKGIEDAAADASLSRGQALLLLSILNDVDGAFAQAQYYEPADPKWAPFLFLGPTQAMRFDHRFTSLATKLGFSAYWRSTGQWPDFCQAPSLPYDCKAEVEKLAENDPQLRPLAVYRPVIGNY